MKAVLTDLSKRVLFSLAGVYLLTAAFGTFRLLGRGFALDESTTLPEQFLLEVPARNKTYRAELRWKSRDAAGAKFLGEVAKAVIAGTDHLREEVTLLRRRNAEMAADHRSDLMPAKPRGSLNFQAIRAPAVNSPFTISVI
jgi:hypothetical protein